MADEPRDGGENRTKPISQTIRIRPPTGEISTVTTTQTMRVRGAPTGELSPVLLTRYRVVERDGGRAVVADDARNLVLWVKPGLVVSEEARHAYPPRVIFLDGAFNGPPFLDNPRRQYSLDHHEGVIRPFTLSTCEQAAVMLLKGLEVGEGEWHLYVNQPDLDALFGAWIFMNHTELLRDQAAFLRAVMPLLRVEGVIDTHGFEMSALTGMPEVEYQAQKSRLDQLLALEKEHRTAGTWASVDQVAYAADRLSAIDALLSNAGMMRERAHVEVLDECEIQEQKLAVLCRSTGGIYEVEARLRDQYGKKLAIVLLETAEQRFTVKQVDPFLSRDLIALYQALNARDPQARTQSDGNANLWGGSADIGGSPRQSGSGLSPDEILEIVGRVYRNTSWLGRLIGRKK